MVPFHQQEIGKIQNIRFFRNLYLNIRENFFDADIIIVTASVNRAQWATSLFDLDFRRAFSLSQR